MNFAKIMENDIVDCDDGIAVSLWFNGCPHRCTGCHNSHLFDVENEVNTLEVAEKIIELIPKNGVIRNFSVLGGEPLWKKNLFSADLIIRKVRENFPNIKIYVWTGYTLEELKEREYPLKNSTDEILKNIDVLIDGRFEIDKREITLKLRGSSNQRILYKGKDF